MNGNDYAQQLGGQVSHSMMGAGDMMASEDDAKLLSSCIDDLVNTGEGGLDVGVGLDGFDFGLDFGLGGAGGGSGAPSPNVGNRMASPMMGVDRGAPGGSSAGVDDGILDRAQQRAALSHQHAHAAAAAAASAGMPTSQAGLYGDGGDALLSMGMDALDQQLLNADLAVLGGHLGGMPGAGGLGMGARFAGMSGGANAIMLQQHRAARMAGLRRAQRDRLNAAAASGMLGAGGSAGAAFRSGLLEGEDLLFDDSMMMAPNAMGSIGMHGMRQPPTSSAASAAAQLKGLQQRGMASNAALMQRQLMRGNALAQQRMLMGVRSGQLGGLGGRRTSAPSNLAASLDAFGAFAGGPGPGGAGGGGGGGFAKSLSSAGLELGQQQQEEGAALSCKAPGAAGGLEDVSSFQQHDSAAATTAATAAIAAATAAATVASQQQQQGSPSGAAGSEPSGAAGCGGGLRREPSLGSKRKAAGNGGSGPTSSRASAGTDGGGGAAGGDGGEGEDEEDEEQGDSAPGSGGAAGRGGAQGGGQAGGSGAAAAGTGGEPSTKRKKKSQNEKIEELKVQVLELREQNQALKKKAGKLASDKSKILTCLTNLSMLVGQKKVENEMLKSKIAQLQEVVCGDDPAPGNGGGQMHHHHGGLKGGMEDLHASDQSQQHQALAQNLHRLQQQLEQQLQQSASFDHHQQQAASYDQQQQQAASFERSRAIAQQQQLAHENPPS